MKLCLKLHESIFIQKMNLFIKLRFRPKSNFLSLAKLLDSYRYEENALKKRAIQNWKRKIKKEKKDNDYTIVLIRAQLILEIGSFIFEQVPLPNSKIHSRVAKLAQQSWCDLNILLQSTCYSCTTVTLAFSLTDVRNNCSSCNARNFREISKGKEKWNEKSRSGENCAVVMKLRRKRENRCVFCAVRKNSRLHSIAILIARKRGDICSVIGD